MDLVLSNRWTVLVIVLLTMVRAHCQNPVLSDGAGLITVDAARLDDVVTVEAAMLLHMGDGVPFAQADLDDASWPLVKLGENHKLASAQVPVGDRVWMRLHIHIRNGTVPLALSMTLHNGLPFAAYANGQKIGESKGFASQTAYLNDSAVMPLPNSPDVVLSVCVLYPGGARVHYVPMEQLTIGRFRTLSKVAELNRVGNFEGRWLTHTVFGLVFLGFVPMGLVLLYAQRRLDYFWFALFCCLLGIDYLLNVAVYAGMSPVQSWMQVITDCLFSGVEIISLEYVASMAELRSRRAVRLVQAVMVGGLSL